MSDMQKAGPTPETGPRENTAADDHTPPATPLYVLIVHRSCGRYRRRCYMQLASAERAVTRARERGEYAEIVLCRVVPVQVIP